MHSAPSTRVGTEQLIEPSCPADITSLLLGTVPARNQRPVQSDLPTWSGRMAAEELMGARLVEAARELATAEHAGQVDKAMRPYIAHPARVDSATLASFTLTNSAPTIPEWLSHRRCTVAAWSSSCTLPTGNSE